MFEVGAFVSVLLSTVSPEKEITHNFNDIYQSYKTVAWM